MLPSFLREVIYGVTVLEVVVPGSASCHFRPLRQEGNHNAEYLLQLAPCSKSKTIPIRPEQFGSMNLPWISLKYSTPFGGGGGSELLHIDDTESHTSLS